MSRTGPPRGASRRQAAAAAAAAEGEGEGEEEEEEEEEEEGEAARARFCGGGLCAWQTRAARPARWR